MKTKHRHWAIVGVYFGSVFVATGFSVGLDYIYFNPDTPLTASLVTFMPTHIAVSALILLGWSVFFAPHLMEKTDVQGDLANSNMSNQDTLSLDTGTRHLDVEISRIDFIRASGNYMEVLVGSEVYVIRQTMKALEVRLRPHKFVRIHRSFLVNADSICSIKRNSSLVLRNGHDLPISHRYKRNVIKIK